MLLPPKIGYRLFYRLETRFSIVSGGEVSVPTPRHLQRQRIQIRTTTEDPTGSSIATQLSSQLFALTTTAHFVTEKKEKRTSAWVVKQMRKGKTAICGQVDIRDAYKVVPCGECKPPCIDDPSFHHRGNEKKTREWIAKKKADRKKLCKNGKPMLPAHWPVKCATTTNRKAKLSYR